MVLCPKILLLKPEIRERFLRVNVDAASPWSFLGSILVGPHEHAPFSVLPQSVQVKRASFPSRQCQCYMNGCSVTCCGNLPLLLGNIVANLPQGEKYIRKVYICYKFENTRYIPVKIRVIPTIAP